MIRRGGEVTQEIRKNMRGGAGEVALSHLLTGEELAPRGQMYSILTLLPGASIGTHVHEGDRECLFVLSGEGCYDHNGTWETLSPGDVALTRAGESHEVRNGGAEPLRLLALIWRE